MAGCLAACIACKCSQEIVYNMYIIHTLRGCSTLPKLLLSHVRPTVVEAASTACQRHREDSLVVPLNLQISCRRLALAI